jgi:ketosteroid isomerase-like protein
VFLEWLPGLVGLVRRSPPGDTSLAMSDNSALVRRFVDAYNRGDAEAIVALVTPDVELETPGGLERGLEAARRLAAKSTQDHALVHIEIERLVEAGDQVVVFAERQMRWRETGELADASPSDAVMTIRGGKMARWQRLRDRREALRLAGLEPTEPAAGEGEG